MPSDSFNLGRPADAAARGALITPAQRIGVKFEEAAARRIVAECGVYPYFIQEYGRVLWREIETPPVTLSEFMSVRELIVDELDQRFFKGRFESATDSEQRYLAVMAGLSDPPYRTAEVAERGYGDNWELTLRLEELSAADRATLSVRPRPAVGADAGQAGARSPGRRASSSR